MIIMIVIVIMIMMIIMICMCIYIYIVTRTKSEPRGHHESVGRTIRRIRSIGQLGCVSHSAFCPCFEDGSGASAQYSILYYIILHCSTLSYSIVQQLPFVLRQWPAAGESRPHWAVPSRRASLTNSQPVSQLLLLLLQLLLVLLILLLLLLLLASPSVRLSVSQQQPAFPDGHQLHHRQADRLAEEARVEGRRRRRRGTITITIMLLLLLLRLSFYYYYYNIDIYINIT